MMCALDEDRGVLLLVRHPYFRAGRLVMQVEDSYVQTAVPLSPRIEITFAHALGEMVTALLDRCLRLTGWSSIAAFHGCVLSGADDPASR